MNIRFEGTEGIARNHTNVDRDTTTYRTFEDTGKVSTSGFALDISGTVMDNSAYAGHGQTAEEVMQQAGQQDITARRNYMAIMSNSMSEEDFAKLQKGGFHPGSEDIETVVTIVDHIKAALIKGGVQVEGYTDTLSEDTLLEITGNEAFARELQKQFEAYDIPLTIENAEAVTRAFEAIDGMGGLTDGTVKYMIENRLQPTVENIYTASFSASGDGMRQGKGYYAAGNVAGYYAKKPETIDYQQLMPQIEKVIEQAGFSVNEETVESAKWLIEKGIPLNEETFTSKKQLEEVVLPRTGTEFVKSAAIAIADGKTPAQADITKKKSNIEKAVLLKQQVEQLKEEAADIIKAKNLPFTLKNMFAAYAEWKTEDKKPIEDVNTEGRNLFAQVKLSMTVGANLRLLRRGISIETMPMEMLAEQLKKADEQEADLLIKEVATQDAKEKNGLYRQTLYTLENIRWAPASIVAEVSPQNTLPEVEKLALTRQAAYQKAGEAYETLMTAPRKDLGDSIHKAFRNVDDILTDMQKDIYDKNRKVVRIMGYNGMEMTEENFEKIRQADGLLTEVTKKMKPATVLSMIREGVNPLTMSLEELNKYLDSMSADTVSEIESYSRFLYQLEQKNDISEAERSAYIGIYRLLRQVEKGDDAALGAVLQAGGTPTLERLLTAVRSGKRKNMDYVVDDKFAGVLPKESRVPTIIDQIQKGYIKNGEQLQEGLSDDTMQEAAKNFDKMIYEQTRAAMGTEEAVLQHLMAYGQTISADNLLFAQSMLRGKGEAFSKYKTLTNEAEEKEEKKENKLLESLSDEETAASGYGEMIEEMQQMLENTVFEEDYQALDIREIGMLYKQLGFMGTMAKEENYEMPVTINGTLTCVNLKMIHNREGECKVTISFETDQLGKNQAEFKIEEDSLTGYGICDDNTVSTLLTEQKGQLIRFLEKEGVQAGDIRFLTTDELDLADFNLRAVKDRIVGKTPDLLYKAAKAYIGYIQEISVQKGSTEYEN